jgi:hypothetical protein
MAAQGQHLRLAAVALLTAAVEAVVEEIQTQQRQEQVVLVAVAQELPMEPLLLAELLILVVAVVVAAIAPLFMRQVELAALELSSCPTLWR